MRYYKAFLLISILFMTACSKKYELNIEGQKSAWQHEFISSSFPFSGSRIKVEILGAVDGVAHLSICAPSKLDEYTYIKSVSSGEFMLEFEALEYWNTKCIIQYHPEPGVVGSFNIKVKFD